MRLIDTENPQNRMYVSDFVIEEMKKIPNVDAVPVVRCRECRHWVKDADEERKDGICETLLLFHGANRYRTNEDFFCACGERRKR